MNEIVRCHLRQYKDTVFHPPLEDFVHEVNKRSPEDFCKWACESKLCGCYMKYFFKLSDVKRYMYFVTFTIKDPAHFEKAKEYVDARIELPYVHKQVNVVEHKDTNVHIHSLIYSDKPIQKSIQFKHYMSKFGFVDFKPVNPKTEQQVLDYMTKEGDPYTLNKKPKKEEAI